MKVDRGNTMSKRWIDIIDYLDEHTVATSEAMAEALYVSPKTIQTELKKLGAVLNHHGAEIISKQRIGYSLIVNDEKKLRDFKVELNQEIINHPMTKEDRIQFQLELLLLNNDKYIKIDDIADQLFISKSSVSQDLKEVRTILEEFNLTLVTRPNYGIKVEGKEFDFRLCTASHTIKRLDFNYHEDTNEQVRKINYCVSKHLNESNIKISDVTYHNLLIHIYIAMIRIKEGHYVPMNVDQLKDMKKSDEYRLAMKVVTELEEIFDIEIPESEIGYLAIHFSGKQFIEIKPEEENFVVTAEIDKIVKHMLSEIKSSYNIDLTNDFELRMSLALHLVPMDIRLKYDMYLRNPLLSEIKQRYTLAYMLATSACGVLRKHYQKDIYEDEISYIALHFNLALERNKSTISKKNIVIVCATGRGSSSLLVYKFKTEVGAYLNTIETCDVGQLKFFDFDTVDYVITTVPIPFSVPKPILEVQFFLDDGDVKALKNLLSGKTSFSFSGNFDPRLFISSLSAKTKEEVIQKMVDKIKEVKTIPDNFYDLVMKRESMAVTAFGNLVAIPHPSEVLGDETFVCIAILDEPIKWEAVEVQFIFMMSMKKERDEDMESFSTMISRLLLNSTYINEMIRTRDYQTLANCFNQIEKEMRSE